MQACSAARRYSQICETDSQSCQLVGIAVLVLALLLPARAGGAPADDYRRGELAYRSGDVVTAMAALRSAANLGHAPSQVLLADILDRAEFDEEALAWYRKAAEQGDPEGEYGLGSMYLAGEGVKRDPGQAWFWFSRAADRNHVPAIIALADAHSRALAGGEAVLPDPSRASEWLRKAADAGYLPAVAALARAFRDGGFGLSPDPAQAARFDALAESIRRKNAGNRGAKKR